MRSSFEQRKEWYNWYLFPERQHIVHEAASLSFIHSIATAIDHAGRIGPNHKRQHTK